MAHRGNRPDCAFFLLIGVAAAAFFLSLGSVCTFVAFWPESALSHLYHHRNPSLSQNPDGYILFNQDKEQGRDMEDVKHLMDDLKRAKTDEDKRLRGNGPMTVIGPLCLVIGFLILLTVTVYAVRYKCDHEPEEPKVALLRLVSEMSLNVDPERNSYELMRNLRPSGRRIEDANQGTSSSSSSPKY